MNYWNDKENCLSETKKYNTVYDLQRNCYGCYMGLKRNGWVYDAYPTNGRPMGYWNNLDNLIKEALKYKTKKEFRENNKSAYNASIHNGLIKELDKFFVKEDRRFNEKDKKNHVIYAYEIKGHNTCYIGQTINLHNRDLSHRRGRKHSDGRITYGGLYKFCEEHNVEIPSPIIKEESLNARESLIQEDYWVNYYKENGWNVLNVAKTGEFSGSLGSNKIWTYEKCKEFCNSYTYKSDLKKANYQCYVTCLENNWFEEFGIIDKKDHNNGYWNIKEHCVEAANECGSKTEFIKRFQGAYKAAMKHNWLDEINDIINKHKQQTVAN